MITKLTDEQRELKQIVKNEWIAALTESTDIDKKQLLDFVTFAYNKMKKGIPRIFIAADPVTAVKMAKTMGCKDTETFHYFGLGYDSGWLAYYDFFSRIGALSKSSKNLLEYSKIAKCGAFAYIFLDKAVIAIRRPLYVRRNDKKQMHCTTGPAIDFVGGGFKSYRLNGIKVPEKLILSPMKITKEDILAETNVDARREMIRHLGIERFTSLTNPKILDRWGDYELLSINLSDELPDCRYLKMKNPSIGIFHVEGVEKDCNTVQQALNWRAGNIDVMWTPGNLT